MLLLCPVEDEWLEKEDEEDELVDWSISLSSEWLRLLLLSEYDL